jgi:hypothetical protein
LFKSVGTALEDLATAQLVYEALKWNPHIYWPLVKYKAIVTIKSRRWESTLNGSFG